MLTKKQQKIAAAAEPRNEITGADFKTLRGKSRPKKARPKMAGAMGLGNSNKKEIV